MLREDQEYIEQRPEEQCQERIFGMKLSEEKKPGDK